MENLRGAALMTLSMLGFAIEDVFIKMLGGRVPAGQIVSVMGAAAAIVFVVWFIVRGQPIFVPAHKNRQVCLRTAFDVMGTLFFVSALTRIDLTLMSAIIQATPLVVALGGVLFLAQSVGWRRWVAILIGFCGVLLIVRPTLDGVSGVIALGVLAMLCLASRDITTRALKIEVSGAHVAFHAFGALIFAGFALCWFEGTPMIVPTLMDCFVLLGCVISVLTAYLLIVAATRTGDAAYISMFRYSRMVFALILGMVILGERPDSLTLIGVAIVIGAGLFTLFRDAQSRRTFQVPPETI